MGRLFPRSAVRAPPSAVAGLWLSVPVASACVPPENPKTYEPRTEEPGALRTGLMSAHGVTFEDTLATFEVLEMGKCGGWYLIEEERTVRLSPDDPIDLPGSSWCALRVARLTLAPLARRSDGTRVEPPPLVIENLVFPETGSFAMHARFVSLQLGRRSTGTPSGGPAWAPYDAFHAWLADDDTFDATAESELITALVETSLLLADHTQDGPTPDDSYLRYPAQ